MVVLTTESPASHCVCTRADVDLGNIIKNSRLDHIKHQEMVITDEEGYSGSSWRLY